MASARRFLTQDVPAIEAAVRERLEDFEVEEVPAYAPAGAGDHTYLRIEKRGVSTHEAVRGIARRLGRRPGEVGVAGLKDARAVSRQWISIEHLADGDVAKVEDPPRVRVLETGRHRNKLKTGHLRGNRFRIRLRLAEGAGREDARGRAREALGRLAAAGIPNYFGLQRFGGEGGRTHELGFALLRDDPEAFVRALLGDRESFPPGFVAERTVQRVLREGGDARRAALAVGRQERELYVSAAQSAVFNAVLDARIEARTLAALETGDVAWIHASGACFVVEDAAREQPRADRFEVSAAGPLFGTRLLAARGAPAERERAALARHGLTETMFFSELALEPRGARRPLRIPLAEVSVDAPAADPRALDLAFFLPAGSYATAVLAELLKRDPA